MWAPFMDILHENDEQNLNKLTEEEKEAIQKTEQYKIKFVSENTKILKRARLVSFTGAAVAIGLGAVSLMQGSLADPITYGMSLTAAIGLMEAYKNDLDYENFKETFGADKGYSKTR